MRAGTSSSCNAGERPLLGCLGSPRHAAQWPCEHVSCYFCGSDANDLLLIFQGFRVVRCARCGLIFTNPRVAEAAARQVYAIGPDGLKRRLANTDPFRAATCRSVIDRLEPLRRTNLLLEVGSGTGVFLQMAKERGWQACGLDISPDAVDHLRNTLGLEAFCGTLRDALPLKPGTIDAVVGLHVAEHFFDPMESFRRVHDLLRPGGAAYFKAPDARALLLRTDGNWACRHLPRPLYRRYLSRYYRVSPRIHTVHYTPETLSRMLERAGLCPVEVATRLPLREVPVKRRTSRLGYWLYLTVGCPLHFAVLAMKKEGAP